jgi:hypothetical protein
VRRPYASARPITNSTLGPGITMIRSDAGPKVSACEIETMRLTVGAGSTPHHPISQSVGAAPT